MHRARGRPPRKDDEFSACQAWAPCATLSALKRHTTIEGSPRCERHGVTAPGSVRLNVVETGPPDGQPILFLHGWSQSHLCWKNQLESSLATKFRLVAFDLRGHGDSDKPADGYTDGRTWAGDVRAVIDALSLERPLLVGWSYGGLILNDYLRNPDHPDVGGVCYVGAATDLGVETTYEFLGATWNGLLPSGTDSPAGTVFSNDGEEVAKAMRLFLRGCFATSPSLDDELLMLGFNLLCPSRVRAALLSRSICNDDVLAKVSAPACVIHGAADEVIRVGTGRHIASTVTGAELLVYEDVGHAPFWEDPDRFNRDLDRFAVASAGASARSLVI